MAQSMLEERFQMRTHRETREMPVYALVLGKTGSRMKLSADQTPEPTCQRRIFNPGGPQPRGTLMPSRSGDSNIALTGSAIPIATLANSLEGYVDRPVVDQTNLKGLFDLRLEFSRPVPASPNVAASTERPDGPAPADPSGTVIFTAIQEQLGLKLEPVKAPVEVLIIDRAEHPSPD